MVKRAIRVGLLVGSILTLINQYEAIHMLDFSPAKVIRMGMNFIVPFTVSLYSSYSASKKPS